MNNLNPVLLFNFCALLLFVAFAVYLLLRKNKNLVVWTAFLYCVVALGPYDLLSIVWNTVDNLEIVKLATKLTFPFWVHETTILFLFVCALTENYKVFKPKFIFLLSLFPGFLLFKHFTGGWQNEFIKLPFTWFPNYQINPTLLQIYGFYAYLILAVMIFLLIKFIFKTRHPRKRKQALVFLIAVVATIFYSTFVNVILVKFFNFYLPAGLNLSQVIGIAGIFLAIRKYKFLVITPAEAAENIIKVMPEMLFLVDADKKIVRINNSVLEILGHKTTALIGQPVSNFFHDGSGESILDELIQKGTVKDKRVSFLAQDQKEIPAILSSTVVYDTEEKQHFIVYIIIIAKDAREIKKYAENRLAVLTPILKQVSEGDFSRKIEIPEKTDEFSEHQAVLDTMIDHLKQSTEEIQSKNKKLEEQTQKLSDKMQELERLNKILAGMELKTEFIQILNHQLRTPITVFKGYLEIWRSGKYEAFPLEKQNEIKNNILIAADQLSSLVNNMLDAVEVEGGMLELDIKEVNLKELIEDIYRVDFKDRFEEKNIFFKLSSAKEQIINSDKKYLSIVISNLLDNALKYTFQGGVEVKLISEDDSIILSVRDTGIGLSERDKAGLFQKFLRGEVAPKVHPGGSGLGLYIAKKILDAFNGGIEAQSEGRDQGTTFVVRLPVRR